MPIIVALIVVILALGGVVAFLLLGNKSNSSNNGAESDADEHTEGMVEITSSAIKKDLLDKFLISIDRSGVKDVDETSESFIVREYEFPNNLFTDGTITDEQKLSFVANSFDDNLTRYYESSTAKEYATKIYNSLKTDKTYAEDLLAMYPTLDNFINAPHVGYIPESKISDKYKSVFGEEIKKHQDTGTCGIYQYSKELKIYYTTGLGGCGGASPAFVSFYIDSYMNSDSSAYIDLYAISAIKTSWDISVDTPGCSVYSIGSDKLRKCTAEEAKISASESNISLINKTNKDNYDHYHVIFKKIGSDFVFEKVEKIENK